jgi:hypothetical protein
MGWTVLGFFLLDETGPEAHPASCAMGIGSFQGVTRPEGDADHPPIANVAGNRLEPYLHLSCLCAHAHIHTHTDQFWKLDTWEVFKEFGQDWVSIRLARQ